MIGNNTKYIYWDLNMLDNYEDKPAIENINVLEIEMVAGGPLPLIAMPMIFAAGAGSVFLFLEWSHHYAR
jgi:hypothetical protein